MLCVWEHLLDLLRGHRGREWKCVGGGGSLQCHAKGTLSEPCELDFRLVAPSFTRKVCSLCFCREVWVSEIAGQRFPATSEAELAVGHHWRPKAGGFASTAGRELPHGCTHVVTLHWSVEKHPYDVIV
jgi:hypothetical protein